MKIKLKNGDDEKYIDVSFWSMLGAVFICSIVINLTVIFVSAIFGVL